MASMSKRAASTPRRLLTALSRAGMTAAEIAEAYELSPEEVALAVCAEPEPVEVEDIEFLQDDDHRYELWEGKLWRMSPTKKRHGRGAIRMVGPLLRYLEANPIGSVYIAEVGYRLGPRRRLLCPDAAYVSNERDAPVDDDEFFPYAPDIAIEVLSPDKTRPKVLRKARAFLAQGARLVWALDPRRRLVTVHRPAAEPQILSGDDILSGEDVLPGFEVRVADLL